MAYQFEETIKNAMETGVLAGAGVLAATKDQGLVYSKSFGRRSLEKGPESEPLDIDDMMSLASASKLVTSIAALQVVERGFVGVDDDLGGILPELGALKVLRKVEDAEGKIKLEERKGEITLRRLLSHSSGLTYAFISPLVQGYNVSRGLPPFQPFETVTKSFSDPLVAQPGMTWEYGSGIEWAGYLVSRLTGQSLEEYTQGNIALPLGIHDLTYFPHRRNPEQTLKEGKLVSMTRRDPDGNGTVIPDTTPHFLSHAKEEMGGVGIYTSMASYIKILHSLLVNDGKLLKPETADTFFFQPQLSPASRAVLQSKFSHIQPGQERGTPPYVGTFVQVKHDHSLAGLLSLEDVYSGDLKWRRNGYLCWSGMPNIFWFIDRQAGLCGVFGTQLLPSADEQVRKVIDAFEKAMYKDFAL